MAHARIHRLVLEHRDGFLRWLPTCACGWLGSFAQHRRADAELIYREHVDAYTHPAGRAQGGRPRPLTPLEKLPAELRPLPRECEMQGIPHGRAWKMVDALSDGRCHWCRLPFTEQRPPTEDHVIPIAAGGVRRDGVVLSCSPCNSARGSTPFAEYTAAVEAERVCAELEGREYRRPRYRKIGGEMVLSAMTRREVREARAANA